MKASLLLGVLIMCCTGACMGQQEINNWFFGYNGGLNFSGGMPVVTPGSLRGWEGCSSISDRNGNLLFYTDGITVWNRNHQVMANGVNLNGDTLCTQSALITIHPGNPSLYYVFTVAKEAEPEGLQYSVVDMTLNGGLGDVVAGQKNIPLVTPVCEKVTAVRHANANDIWVITHQFGNNSFYIYKIDCAGLNATPIVTVAGNIADKITNTIGYLKASPDGTTLAMAGFTSEVELFDFDANTGGISNPRAITGNPNKITGPYGVEFSPDSKLLYVSESYNNNGSGDFYIFQYKVDTSHIVDSRIAIDSGYGNAAGALQLARDGRVYIAYDQQQFLGAITQPNLRSYACAHVREFIHFPAGITSGVGLPAAVAGLQRTLLPADSTVCSGEKIVARISLPATSFLWQDGTTLDSMVMNAPGLYWVEITHNNCKYRDSITVTWRPRPIVNLGKDTSLCTDKFPFIVQSLTPGATYQWQDASTGSAFTITGQGLYWLEANLNACTARDSLNVTSRTVTTFTLGRDTAICENAQVLLQAGQSFTSYHWSTGNQTNQIMVQDSGLYWLEAVNQVGCSWRDSLQVALKALPVFSFGKDSILCEGNNWLLDLAGVGDSYRWQDGSTQSRYQVRRSGLYYAEVKRQGCAWSDTVYASYRLNPVLRLGEDQEICPGQQILLEPKSELPFIWQNGSTQSSFTVTEPGTYSIAVTTECGTFSDELVVRRGICRIAIPNAFTPGKSQNNSFKVLNAAGLRNFSLRIFNRWGSQVFQTTDPTFGWNGCVSGAPQPAGTYVYMVNYLDDDAGKPVFQKGVLTLIR
ncbi:gliding motility-associated C-terminal domain-containing protein [Paraflavitalea pollutisoli]|uniref:T9SS type B sorting domain-containing protein n=1 Tax=Paraflavitalea pollutisoli TaxID=3034143 RepID=UPI0023EA8781|nr:gliding motility-associated C-terminal domain-containing protein [Paraflavitalea sp. H1-2-19X]